MKLATSTKPVRRVVIVDDSRTMQAIMEQIFSSRLGFEVAGIASDVEQGADMVRTLHPDLVAIDLCMPYVDGGELLNQIADLTDVCKLVISSHGLDSLSVVHRLQAMGADACICKREIIADPQAFGSKIAIALAKGRSASPKLPSVPRMTVAEGALIAAYPIPGDERERIEALASFGLANDDPDHRLDLLTEHLRQVTGFPSGMLTFIGRDKAWVKSAAGFSRGAFPRALAFCSHTIGGSEPLVVANALKDPRFCNHPLVIGEPAIRTYIGVPILSASGVKLGAACLIDCKPRKVTDSIITALKGVATIAGVIVDAAMPVRQAA